MDAPDLIYCIYEFNLILIGEVPLHWIYDEELCLFLNIAECRTSSVFPAEDILMIWAEWKGVRI